MSALVTHCKRLKVEVAQRRKAMVLPAAMRERTKSDEGQIEKETTSFLRSARTRRKKMSKSMTLHRKMAMTNK
jgi:hypothetical protein